MSTNTTTEETGRFAWYRTLGRDGKKAFAGAAGGWGLDAYDFQVLPLALTAIVAYFGLTKGEAGLIATVTLVVSAFGGAIAGVLADRIGRVRTLMLTVSTYAFFTVLCGFAWNYESLMVFRALQGLGFGGEWAAGAILVAEYCHSRYRGRTVAFIQSSWAVGWGLAVLSYLVVFQLFEPDVAWRVLFWTGALPAVLIIYLRRNVKDAPQVTERRATSERKGSFKAIFQGDLRRKTLFAALLASGVQGGYYTLATWLPAYLRTERGLTVINTTGYLACLIAGAFAGYLTGGVLTDKLGRKKTFLLFAVLSAVFILLYTQIPAGANTLVLIVGVPLGFCSSAIFSGFGSFLAELYPHELRGTGQGFTYNFGRGIGALFPGAVGFFADSWGLGGAMVFGALAYAIAAVALIWLPERSGQELT